MEITTVVNSSESHTAVKEMNYNYMRQYVNIQIQSARLILRMLVLYYKADYRKIYSVWFHLYKV